MKFLRSRRGIAVIVGLLLVLFLFRPGVHRLRNRIADTIGSALGRNVAIDDVRFRILPRPGFDLEGLVIYDDPSFSAEPMIRAQDVFAAIRFRSLLRGKLEIATLSATEPSINIVRNNEGRWNLASLLERNAQIPVAPTKKASSETRPAFPYLEASNARINFKIGQAKKSYALTDADVALWQESENSWGARMKAQPVRTDFNLTDTGQLRINATWARASNLHLTPLRLSMAWEYGQLGQITTLLTGADRGWRGGVDLTANISGTPAALVVESRAAVAGFRRYDIVDNRIVNLATHCTGKYDTTNRTFSGILCESPVDNGMVRVRGEVGVKSADPDYDLTLAVEKFPMAAVVGLLHQAKQQLPVDLTAEGLLDAEFHATRNGSGPAQLSGNGSATDVRLSAGAGRDVVAIGSVPLTLVGNSGKTNRVQPMASAKTTAQSKGDFESAEAHVRIGPASLKVNASAPLSAGGWVSAAGYRFFLRGDVDLKNLFRLEATLGLPAARPAAEGDAKLDVSISGAWRGLNAPTAFGTAQLHNIRAETRGLNVPIEISSATVVLAPDAFSLQKLSAQTGSTHWSGSVTAPRRCAPACLFQFDLTADQLSSKDLAAWFTPRAATRPWYRILSSSDQVGPSPLRSLEAQGRLQVGQLTLRKLLAGQVTTQIAIHRGKVVLAGLHGQLMQGTHQGNWTIDTTVQPPLWHGIGAFQNISLATLTPLMNDPWIAGSADASFELETSGEDFSDLLSHADGQMQFVMRNGRFNHVQISSADGALPVHRFAGDLRVKKGVWELSGGRLESRDGMYQVTGTASPAEGLNFNFTRDDEQSWNLTGTIAKPHVARANQEISRTDAAAKSALKP
jgi:AsmA protein